MGSTSYLHDNFEKLCDEMKNLIALRDDVITRGEPRMAGWLQIVKEKEDDVEGIGKDLKKLKFIQIDAKNKLNNRIVSSITAVKALIATKDEISNAMETFISEVTTGKPKQFSCAQLKKYTSDFATKLGSGVFGIVYKGTLPDGVQVAVKVLHEGMMMDNMEKEFKVEVNTMSKTYHRNLAELYGFCFDAKMKALVYEYVENGSLDQILYKNPSNVPWEKLYKIAIGTAKGLSYFHESCKERIIHRDIKAGNVLLDSKFLPKLTDFGLAKLSSMDNSQVTLTVGLRRARSYDAPEVRLATTQKINYKSDVFSFGMLLFEILSRKKWETGNLIAKEVWEKYQNGILDEVLTKYGIGENDKEKANTLSIVALLCIEQKAGKRPSMSEVVNILVGVVPPGKPSEPFL
ncbi:hypothetical protein AQUCO_01000569v1 [Aquilegia coerulea]|uniref:non-specific serine/threonine protein kinase n=1 Tax=Aquilegia coerulea TaxID=218851 RepID=A0A2G5EAK2_AQUCA|nr:hypothetical protein AQUCO_01000569v1 [Aquilegia coerulea]